MIPTELVNGEPNKYMFIMSRVNDKDFISALYLDVCIQCVYFICGIERVDGNLKRIGWWIDSVFNYNLVEIQLASWSSSNYSNDHEHFRFGRVMAAAAMSAVVCSPCVYVKTAFSTPFLSITRKAPPCSHSQQNDVSMSITCKRPWAATINLCAEPPMGYRYFEYLNLLRTCVTHSTVFKAHMIKECYVYKGFSY